MGRIYLTELEKKALNEELLLLADIIGVDEEGNEFYTAPAIRLALIISKRIKDQEKDNGRIPNQSS